MMNKDINKILEDEKEITYEECKELWEDEKTLVHRDTSERVVRDVTNHISMICELSADDVLLNIGCGDGAFDQGVLDKVKMLYGIDFSGQKISVAKRRTPLARYYQQSFLDGFVPDILEAGINKIYSYSVVQYCKPEDLELFIDNQLAVLDRNKPFIIAHLDVPDIEKAVFYYQKMDPSITQDMLRGRIKTLFGDGSYWHQMDQFREIALRHGLVCEVKDAHYWKYRSDIIYKSCDL